MNTVWAYLTVDVAAVVLGRMAVLEGTGLPLDLVEPLADSTHPERARSATS